MAKVGRPNRVFTKEELEKIDDMCLLNCKDYTIAEVIGVRVEVLKNSLCKRLVQKRAEGRVKLRQWQRNMAPNTPSLAIFLGKNELGQADKQEHKHGVTEELGNLLGLIDGSSKGKLPNNAEKAEAGQ